ncbi:MAG: hypothetical protein ACLP52_08290 [Streptosporangiaceae bacterium]
MPREPAGRPAASFGGSRQRGCDRAPLVRRRHVAARADWGSWHASSARRYGTGAIPVRPAHPGHPGRRRARPGRGRAPDPGAAPRGSRCPNPELLLKSPDFARLWERYDVTRRTAAQKKTFHHPHVGTITLGFQGMQLEGTPGQRLGVYVTEPGTPDYDAMILLDMTTPHPAGSRPSGNSTDIPAPAGRGGHRRSGNAGGRPPDTQAAPYEHRVVRSTLKVSYPPDVPPGKTCRDQRYHPGHDSDQRSARPGSRLVR